MLSNVIRKVQQVLKPQDGYKPVERVADFAGVTDLEAVVEAKEKLAKVDALLKKDLQGKMQIVLKLDEKTYPKVQNLTHSYLTSLSGNDTLKQSVEGIIYEYLRRLYATYTLMLDASQNQNKSTPSPDEINLILVRYLNALFLMAKWRYFDDQEAPLGVWDNVHKVIRLSEAQSLMNKNLFLYDFQKKETSIAAILKRGLMLDTLQKGSYNPLQIELTERVINAWSSNPIISKRYQQNKYQFFIHLEGDKRPQRLRGAKGHPDFRYWKTQRIVDLLENYLCAVETRKPLVKFKLGKMASTEEFVQLFKKLRVDWCIEGYKRQRRNESRDPNFKMLTVVHGVENICLHVWRSQQSGTRVLKPNSDVDIADIALMDQGSNSSQGLNSSKVTKPVMHDFDALDIDHWTMLEESNTGFSVNLVKGIGPWVKSGVLIGYLSEDSQHNLSIAEIKTVRKRSNGSYRLGLLKISETALALRTSLLQKSNVFSPTAGHEVDEAGGELSYSPDFFSLFIDDGDHKKSTLIVPKAMYKRAHRYQVTMHGDQHMLLAGDVISKHHNWVCFDVIV